MRSRDVVFLGIATFASATALILPKTARADGFQLSGLSVTGLASANAIVANPVTLGAIPYNPALMAYHPGQQLIAGTVASDSHLEALPGSGGAQSSEVANPRFVPDADYFATWGHWSAGLGLDTPYGFETDWPVGTFSTAVTLQPLATKLSLYDLHPMVAVRKDGVALGAELDEYEVRDLMLTSPGTQILGGGDKAGYSLGIAIRRPRWTFGARYRSAANIAIDGAQNGIPANTLLPLPWSFQVGVNHFVSKRWSIEADFQRTGWNRLQNLHIAGPGGTTLLSNTFDWTATNAYRLATSYRLPEGVTVHAGFALDQNPEPNSYFSARVPAAQSRTFSLGATQQMGPWALDAGLAYVRFAQLTIASTVAPGTSGTNMNGTSAYNGRYRGHDFLLGVGLTRRF